MRRAILLLSILPLLGAGGVQDPAHSDSCPEDCSPCGKAVARGLKYVNANMKKVWNVPVIRVAERLSAPYNSTAAMVAGLAYLMAGESKHRSDIKYVMDRAKAYLKEVEKQEMNVCNWPVALAGMLFAELYQRKSYKSKARPMLKTVVRILESAQQEDGGWGHQEKGKPLRHNVWKYYPKTLTSSTSLAAAALALLRSGTGAKVKDETLQKAFDNLKRVQRSDGGMGYDLTRIEWGSEAGRTAGALLALLCLEDAGVDAAETAKVFEPALRYVQGRLDTIPEGHGSSAFHVMVAGLAFFLQGAEEGREFRRKLLDRILESQQKDGSFDCICSGKNEMTCLQMRQEKLAARSKTPEEKELHLLQGRVLVTAFYCVFLQLKPDGLEILKRPEKRRRDR